MNKINIPLLSPCDNCHQATNQKYNLQEKKVAHVFRCKQDPRYNHRDLPHLAYSNEIVRREKELGLKFSTHTSMAKAKANTATDRLNMLKGAT